ASAGYAGYAAPQYRRPGVAAVAHQPQPMPSAPAEPVQEVPVLSPAQPTVQPTTPEPISPPKTPEKIPAPKDTKKAPPPAPPQEPPPDGDLSLDSSLQPPCDDGDTEDGSPGKKKGKGEKKKKEDCEPRFWGGVDYLLWQIQNGPLPLPLVTTGP